MLDYGGSVGYAMDKAGMGNVGRAADVDSLLEDIDGLERKRTNARKHFKLTPELDAEIDTQIKNRYTDIENVLGNVRKDTRRTEIIERFSRQNSSFADAFDSDGKMKADFRRRLGMDGEDPIEVTDYEVQDDAENPAEDGGVRYSIKRTSKMDYGEQLDMIESRYQVVQKDPRAESRLKNEPIGRSDSLYVGTPSQTLTSAGMSDAPFAMNQGDYRKSRRDKGNNPNNSAHSVSYGFFENLPTHLENAPMLIDNGDKVTIITDFQQADENGEPSYVVAGVWQNAKIDNDTVNQIKSTYPLENFVGKITQHAENGKLVIINESKADEMLSRVGKQYSERSRIISLAKKSISQSKPVVNPSGAKTQRNLHPEFYKGDKARVSRALEKTGLTAVSDMESLSAVERRNYRELVQAADVLDRISGGHFDFVLAETNDKVDGSYVGDEDVVIISRETLQSPKRNAEALSSGWFGTLIHETSHKTNSNAGKEYNTFAKLMIEDTDAVRRATDEIIRKGYLDGMSETEAREAIAHIIEAWNGESRADQDAAYARLSEQEHAVEGMVYDEMVAHIGRDKLSTERFYRRLMEADKSAASRMLGSLRRLIQDLGKKTEQANNPTGKLGKALLKAAKVQEAAFLNAVQEAGFFVDLNGMISGGEEEREDVTENGVRRSIIRRTYSPEQTDQNIKGLANMESVYNVDETKLEKTGKRPSEIYAEYFKKWGENIYTDEFGDVALKASSVKSEIRHGNTAEKIATIEAIPTVLKEGKVIFSNVKQGDVERVVVAAPIKIGTDSYYMGIMLQRDAQNQRLYLHNVVAEKETATSSVWSLTNRTDDTGSDSLFITSILQNALNVKPSEQDFPDVRESKKEQTGPPESIANKRRRQAETQKRYTDRNKTTICIVFLLMILAQYYDKAERGTK